MLIEQNAIFLPKFYNLHYLAPLKLKTQEYGKLFH